MKMNGVIFVVSEQTDTTVMFEVIVVKIVVLTLCLLVSSTDKLCKEFGPRPGPTKCQV